MPEPPRRTGRLGALLGTGRLDELLECGGVTVGPPERDEAAREARRVARRAEIDRLLGRPERLAGTPLPPTAPPTRLDDVLDDLCLPARPLLDRTTTERGRVSRLTWRYPLTAFHGAWRHADALSAPTDDLARLGRDERLRHFGIRDALFLDIESTGLSHGAGTYAFLVGLAWFDDDALVLEQLFLEDPSDEAALLDAFTARRASRPYLASFNGRCYDVHVLQSRLVLNRVCDEAASALQLTPHVDLLHLSRAVHGGRFENNRLQTLEHEVLGFVRDGDDVPGELIPGLYFTYLQTSDAAPLAPVFRHNAWDVLSMVGLYTHICQTVAADGRGAAARVRANLGHLWLSRGDAARAARVLATVATRDNGLEPDARDRALVDAVTALKRCLRDAPIEEQPGYIERLGACLEVWLALAPDDPTPHVELSRLHERATGEIDGALRHARAALSRLERTASAEERGLALRRVARLEKRCARRDEHAV